LYLSPHAAIRGKPAIVVLPAATTRIFAFHPPCVLFVACEPFSPVDVWACLDRGRAQAVHQQHLQTLLPTGLCTPALEPRFLTGG